MSTGSPDLVLLPPPFPISVDQLDTAFLGAALDVEVLAFRSNRIGADRGMLGEIFVRDLDTSEGTRSIVAKFAALREEALTTARQGRTNERELRCYDELLATTPVRTPACHGSTRVRTAEAGVSPGTTISGVGHGALLRSLVVGGWFQSAPPPPLETADVSILTEEEFAALVPQQAEPSATTEISAPETPAVEDNSAAAPAPEDPPETTDAPETETPQDPDAAPEVPETPEVLDPLLSEDTSVLVAPETPVLETPVIAPPSDNPAPLDAPRVAPLPTPEVPAAPDISEQLSPPTSDTSESPDPVEEAPEAAPEQATTEIVTEAETPGAGAPLTSLFPVVRPGTPPLQAEPEPEDAPEQTAEPESESPGFGDAINDALADALTEPTPAATPVPSGPPLSSSERDGLRVAVQQCWNVGSLSSEALNVTVIVAVSMAENGKPDNGTIRMTSFSGGSETSANQAFEAARRAIIRCGAKGFDLPAEKYEQWREIEMTFNPERMRIK